METVEDKEWTRRYHSDDLAEKAFGGRVVIELADGTVVEDEMAVADAHPLGARPFGRAEYIGKFRSLADGIVAPDEQERFLDVAQRLPGLSSDELAGLTFASLDGGSVDAVPAGLF